MLHFDQKPPLFSPIKKGKIKMLALASKEEAISFEIESKI
jgi:hypothetical protein